MNLKERARNESVNISTTSTSATIINLDPHTKYEVEVQGINDNGQKSPSNRLNVTTSAPTGKAIM